MILPPALLALLQPYASGAVSTMAKAPTLSVSEWSMLASGLAHKAKLLQTENDELYEKVNESATLKHQVRALCKVVSKLEHALEGELRPQLFLCTVSMVTALISICFYRGTCSH